MDWVQGVVTSKMLDELRTSLALLLGSVLMDYQWRKRLFHFIRAFSSKELRSDFAFPQLFTEGSKRYTVGVRVTYKYYPFQGDGILPAQGKKKTIQVHRFQRLVKIDFFRKGKKKKKGRQFY